jgi:hypothetical protein
MNAKTIIVSVFDIKSMLQDLEQLYNVPSDACANIVNLFEDAMKNVLEPNNAIMKTFYSELFSVRDLDDEDMCGHIKEILDKIKSDIQCITWQEWLEDQEAEDGDDDALMAEWGEDNEIEVIVLPEPAVPIVPPPPLHTRRSLKERPHMLNNMMC